VGNQPTCPCLPTHPPPPLPIPCCGQLVRERSLAASLSLSFKLISGVHWLEWPALSDVFLQLLRVASQGIGPSSSSLASRGAPTSGPLPTATQPQWRQCLVVVEKHAFALAVHISRRFAVVRAVETAPLTVCASSLGS
jgi:hypothetical protein